MKVTKVMLLAGTALSVLAGSVMAQEAATVGS